MNKEHFISEILTDSKKCSEFYIKKIEKTPKEEENNIETYQGYVRDNKIGNFYFTIKFIFPEYKRLINIKGPKRYFWLIFYPLLNRESFISFYKNYYDKTPLESCAIPDDKIYTIYKIFQKVAEKEKESIFVKDQN